MNLFGPSCTELLCLLPRGEAMDKHLSCILWLQLQSGPGKFLPQLTFILLTFVIIQKEKWKFNFTVQWAGEILTSLLRHTIVLIGASLYKKINWKMN